MTTTIRPKTPCTIKRRTGSFDGHGRPVFSTSLTKTKCAIVDLYDTKEKTSVRADSSASRGKSEENTARARLLLKPRETIATGDVIEVNVDGNKTVVEIDSIFRRVDINGRVHHIDVEGEIWVSG